MRLGKYEILEEIGQGGFGVVYKAKDLSLDRLVALKVLHPQLTVDPRFIENFRKEARLMAKITHPNVVVVHDIDEFEGRVFIAIQYLPGGSLEEKIAAQGPIPFEEALEISRQITKALEAGHKKNLIHRDVKPANILFDEDGNALLGDFGVAHTVQVSSMGTMSQVGVGVGTPSYRPPELWNGTPPPSPATDQYSLACVFYEMLSGDKLFGGETTEQIMVKLLIQEPDLDTLESEGLRMILKKAISKNPAERFSTIDEFQANLETLIQSKSETPDASEEDEGGSISEENAIQLAKGLYHLICQQNKASDVNLLIAQLLPVFNQVPDSEEIALFLAKAYLHLINIGLDPFEVRRETEKISEIVDQFRKSERIAEVYAKALGKSIISERTIVGKSQIAERNAILVYRFPESEPLAVHLAERLGYLSTFEPLDLTELESLENRVSVLKRKFPKSEEIAFHLAVILVSTVKVSKSPENRQRCINKIIGLQREFPSSQNLKLQLDYAIALEKKNTTPNNQTSDERKKPMFDTQTGRRLDNNEANVSENRRIVEPNESENGEDDEEDLIVVIIIVAIFIITLFLIIFNL